MQEPTPDGAHSPAEPGAAVDHRLTRLEENLMHESYLREQQHEQIVALLKLATQLTQRIKGLEARLTGALEAQQSQVQQDRTSDQSPGASDVADQGM